LNSTATKGFFKLCLATLVAVYFLIAVGGIVRATGSGMGCPDWPKCFEQWVPPTSVDQLPTNYKEIFAQGREKKNQKFVRYLKALGMNKTADRITADKSILVEADFNAVKTWIEYLNRLAGVVIGLLIIALFWKSRSFRKQKPTIFWVAAATLVAVIFQGWFGSIVVSTNLTTWTITIHMFIALVIVSMLNYLLLASNSSAVIVGAPKKAGWLVLACSVVLLMQIFLGTQVREAIDRLAALSRESWISTLGLEFIIHRSFSWLVVGLHLILLWRLYKTTGAKVLTRVLFVLILASFFTGVGMAYFNVPAFLQPVHLVLASICFGFQQYLLFALNSKATVVFDK
jgi:cytochrome c oxidase assembly protein subunit 15